MVCCAKKEVLNWVPYSKQNASLSVPLGQPRWIATNEVGVNRFSDRQIWPWKASGLWIFSVNRADLRILKTMWIVDQLWILARIPDCACLDTLFFLLEYRGLNFEKDR